MSNYHPDFVVIPTGATWGFGSFDSDPYAIGAEISTAESLENLRAEVREYNEDTRRMLDEFTADFDAIALDSERDSDDILCDFDANEDKWFA